jgi:hypothetical protein
MTRRKDGTNASTESETYRAQKASGRLTFEQDPEEYRRVAQNQRDYFEELARRFESNDPLDLQAYEREMVAGLLRFWANQIPVELDRKKQGPKPKFDAADAALEYALLRRKGMSNADAVEKITERISNASPPQSVDISPQAVSKGIKKFRAAAFAFLSIEDPDKK